MRQNEQECVRKTMSPRCYDIISRKPYAHKFRIIQIVKGYVAERTGYDLSMLCERMFLGGSK